MLRNYLNRLKVEFNGYNAQSLIKDLLAGLTVAAVALPLALAFGVSSGADAAAGLLTAIIAGFLIGGLSGASYQISGPTGAMSAILIGLSAQYGIQAVFLASCMSGIILIICSLIKAGKLVSYIPASVITGFTSGIAIIIAGGQIDNFFGTTSAGSNLIEKIGSYFTLGFHIDINALMFGLLVVAIMVFWPKKWQKVFPSSLAGIIVALIVHIALPQFTVAEVGAIPTTLFPEARLTISAISLDQIKLLITPAISIAALGMIESLLCGASAGNMKNEIIDADQELMAQGVGNMIIPFFGGVPATAAIARTSVAIKAGGQTRMVSIFHSVVLLMCMFLFGGLMSRIPMAALAGVLMVTAWRMNEWVEIKHIFKKALKSNIAKYLFTMIATIVFDLTTAIMIGIFVSIILFVINNAKLEVDVRDIDITKLDHEIHHKKVVKTAYVSGPIFFANQGILKNAILAQKDNTDAFIVSMRAVPTLDESGIGELKEIANVLHSGGKQMILCGLSRSVINTIERFDALDDFDNIMWDAIKAMEFLEAQYEKEEK